MGWHCDTVRVMTGFLGQKRVDIVMQWRHKRHPQSEVCQHCDVFSVMTGIFWLNCVNIVLRSAYWTLVCWQCVTVSVMTRILWHKCVNIVIRSVSWKGSPDKIVWTLQYSWCNRRYSWREVYQYCDTIRVMSGILRLKFIDFVIDMVSVMTAIVMH